MKQHDSLKRINRSNSIRLSHFSLNFIAVYKDYIMYFLSSSIINFIKLIAIRLPNVY